MTENDFPEITCSRCGNDCCGPDVFREELCTFCALERFPKLEKEIERLNAIIDSGMKKDAAQWQKVRTMVYGEQEVPDGEEEVSADEVERIKAALRAAG